MVFKISMNPGNFMTQIIVAPGLSEARETAQEIEERYTEVEPYLGSEVRFFMPSLYAEGFVNRFLATDFGTSCGVFHDTPSLFEKGGEELGFTRFEATHVTPNSLEILMGIAPREAVFMPIDDAE